MKYKVSGDTVFIFFINFSVDLLERSVTCSLTVKIVQTVKMLLEEQVRKIADEYVAKNYPTYSFISPTIQYYAKEKSEEVDLARKLCAELNIKPESIFEPHYVITYSLKDKNNPLTLIIDAAKGEVLRALKKA